MTPIGIRAFATAHAAGSHIDDLWDSLCAGTTRIQFNSSDQPIAPLPPAVDQALERLQSEPAYKHTDRAVALGLLTARALAADLGAMPIDTGVFMGTSRGATHKIEEQLRRFDAGRKVSPYASPMSTTGVFAATICQDLQLAGMHATVSTACTSSLNALGMALGMMELGLLPAALVGGAEASLTPFTLAQLTATGIYSKSEERAFPMRPGHPERNGTVVGEGAALLHLTKNTDGCRFQISGFGAASEKASMTGITDGGAALQQSMNAALGAAGLDERDIALVVGHGAGTKKGDAVEMNLYERFFRNQPPIVFHKWVCGHLLGAAGTLSVLLAIKHLETRVVPATPYLENTRAETLVDPRHVLVNGLGFGGGAASVVVSAV